MTDSGEPPKSPPQQPDPLWPPPPEEPDPKQTPAGGPTSSSPSSFDVAATMRLIPVPPPSTPPPSVASITKPAPVSGERYIGKYRVKGELGRGGMGAVYLAEQPGLGREVAIKELIQSADPVALRRFLHEAQVMARTSHPNLVQVHDMELMGNVNYLVLEFVRGRSLRDWINEKPIPPPQVFAIMHGVLQALDYAHRRAIVHRDMSPEQVSSSKVDGRSDLYSTGIMFYELVAGQPPFTATEADGPFTLMAKHVQAPPKPPSVFRPGLNPELEQVIMKSLAKRPEDRYQTGQEFDHAMSRVADLMCPGWLRSLEPGADLSRMVPTATPPYPIPSTPIGIAISQPGAAIQQQHAAYNPTPPVKPVVKKSMGCLSVSGLIAVATIGVGLLVGSLIR